MTRETREHVLSLVVVVVVMAITVTVSLLTGDPTATFLAAPVVAGFYFLNTQRIRTKYRMR